MVLFSDEQRFELLPSVARASLLPAIEGGVAILLDPAPGGRFDPS